MIERKPISKKTREIVYEKYNGHCAYCGCDISMKEMQVDHLHPVYRTNAGDDANHIDNLMPSCRQCNFYKDTYTIDGFRSNMQSIMQRVRKPFIYRLAEKYGMVKEEQWDGKFYFEKT